MKLRDIRLETIDETPTAYLESPELSTVEYGKHLADKNVLAVGSGYRGIANPERLAYVV